MLFSLLLMPGQTSRSLFLDSAMHESWFLRFGSQCISILIRRTTTQKHTIQIQRARLIIIPDYCHRSERVSQYRIHNISKPSCNRTLFTLSHTFPFSFNSLLFPYSHSSSLFALLFVFVFLPKNEKKEPKSMEMEMENVKKKTQNPNAWCLRHKILIHMVMQGKSHQMKIYERMDWARVRVNEWMNAWERERGGHTNERANERTSGHTRKMAWKPKKGRLLNLNHNLFVLEIGRMLKWKCKRNVNGNSVRTHHNQHIRIEKERRGIRKRKKWEELDDQFQFENNEKVKKRVF